MIACAVSRRTCGLGLGLAAGLLALTWAAVPPAARADSASNVSVEVGDTSYSRWTVSIPVGGSVTWTNVGTAVHTATTPGPSTANAFDTGGLTPGQSSTVAFTSPGAFHYSSAPDCLNGNLNHAFNCAAWYAVVVGGVAPAAAPPQPAEAVMAPASVVVNVGDGSGFQPNTLTIAAGQSITFTNVGQNIHSAVGDKGVFDTGGIAPGQSATINFATPGAYAFHSSTEPIYGRDAFGENALAGYVWNGLITVR